MSLFLFSYLLPISTAAHAAAPKVILLSLTKGVFPVSSVISLAILRMRSPAAINHLFNHWHRSDLLGSVRIRKQIPQCGMVINKKPLELSEHGCFLGVGRLDSLEGPYAAGGTINCVAFGTNSPKCISIIRGIQ
jgi:hypothetical protein